MDNKTYSTGKFAKLLGVTPRTLQRWDLDGKLVAFRTPAGRRFYTDEQYHQYMQLPAQKMTTRRRVCYTRVSGENQKQDLRNQIEALERFVTAQGLVVDQWLSDIGSGLNYERKAFNALMNAVDRDEISEMILAHQDRLVRFGYEWFEHFCQAHGCKITVLNLESLSPQEEVTGDLRTILQCFSSRLDGLRRYQQEINRIIATKSEDEK